jgi:hypothetical protein
MEDVNKENRRLYQTIKLKEEENERKQVYPSKGEKAYKSKTGYNAAGNIRINLKVIKDHFTNNNS